MSYCFLCFCKPRTFENGLKNQQVLLTLGLIKVCELQQHGSWDPVVFLFTYLFSQLLFWVSFQVKRCACTYSPPSGSRSKGWPWKVPALCDVQPAMASTLLLSQPPPGWCHKGQCSSATVCGKVIHGQHDALQINTWLRGTARWNAGGAGMTEVLCSFQDIDASRTSSRSSVNSFPKQVKV